MVNVTDGIGYEKLSTHAFLIPFCNLTLQKGIRKVSERYQKMGIGGEGKGRMNGALSDSCPMPKAIIPSAGFIAETCQ
jgi:hypothetical protein